MYYLPFCPRPQMTALMGSSGAGKTTLLDVLAGRKTGGTTTGDIRLNGHPKLQKTFTRQAAKRLLCGPLLSSSRSEASEITRTHTCGVRLLGDLTVLSSLEP